MSVSRYREMLRTDYPLTRRHIPEKTTPKQRRCENLKTREHYSTVNVRLSDLTGGGGGGGR